MGDGRGRERGRPPLLLETHFLQSSVLSPHRSLPKVPAKASIIERSIFKTLFIYYYILSKVAFSNLSCFLWCAFRITVKDSPFDLRTHLSKQKEEELSIVWTVIIQQQWLDFRRYGRYFLTMNAVSELIWQRISVYLPSFSPVNSPGMSCNASRFLLVSSEKITEKAFQIPQFLSSPLKD